MDAKPRPGRPPLSLALGFRTDPEARDLARGASLRAGRLRRRSEALREARLPRGEGRARAHVLAHRVRPARAALEALSGERPRAAPPRACPAVGGARRPGRRLAGRGGHRPGLAVCAARRQPPLPTTPARAADVRAVVHRPRRHREAPAVEAARSAARAGRAGRRPGAPALRRRPPACRTPGLCARCVRARCADGPARCGGERRRGRGTLRQGSPGATPSVASARSRGASRTTPTVRFHLGVLLLWTARIQEAQRQFRLAAATQPGSPLARRHSATSRRSAGHAPSGG